MHNENAKKKKRVTSLSDSLTEWVCFKELTNEAVSWIFLIDSSKEPFIRVIFHQSDISACAVLVQERLMCTLVRWYHTKPPSDSHKVPLATRKWERERDVRSWRVGERHFSRCLITLEKLYSGSWHLRYFPCFRSYMFSPRAQTK